MADVLVPYSYRTGSSIIRNKEVEGSEAYNVLKNTIDGISRDTNISFSIQSEPREIWTGIKQ